MTHTLEVRRAQSGRWLVLGTLLFLLPVFGAAAEGSSTSTVSSSSDGSSYILVSGDSAVGLGASGEDLGKARELRGTAGEDLLWARRNGKTWVVRDAAVLAEAHKLLDAQGQLAETQAAHGTDQASLGKRQREIGKQQGDVERQIDALEAQVAKAGGQQKKDLEQQLNAAQDKKRELGRQQAEIGKQQAEIGKQQAAMGEKQGANAETAEPRLRALIDEAIHKGLAQEVKQ